MIKKFIICLMVSLVLVTGTSLLIPELRSAITQIAGLAVLETTAKWNNLRDAAGGDNLTRGVGAFVPYVYDGTNFDRVRGDTTYGMDVDVTRVSGNVTVIGTSTPADNFANPTTAINTWSLMGLYDGSTWDLWRNSTHGDNLTTVSGANVASFNYVFDGTNWDRVRGASTSLPGSVLVDNSSNASSNIVANASTVVKASAGYVNMLVVNTGGTSSTVAFYNDATSPCDTNLVGTLATVTSGSSVKLEHSFTTGICALTAGTAAADISVMYR
jgi:hypothetical protein